MKKLTFILLTFFSICIQAQPVLNSSDFPQSFAANAFTASTTGFSNGSAGENQIWDFSSIALIPTTYSMSVVPTSSAPFGSFFPNANYTYEFNDNGLFFYNIQNLNSDSFEYLAYTETSSVEDYSANSDIIFQFPYTYGTDLTDTYQSSFPSSQPETVNRVYDAYGTLITPFGTFSNVIRQKTVSSFGDIFYNWMSTNPFQIILQGNFEDDIVYFWQSSNLEVEDFKINSFSIYPNPTNRNLSIKNVNSIDKEVVVTIYDVLGNAIIENKELNSTIENIDLSDFSSGLYFVKIMNKNNQLLYSEKIVKQ